MFAISAVTQIANSDSLAGVHLDNLAASTQLSDNSRYIELLERTNQQLSLWLNPYGIMIGALGVLFAILAIVASIIIWRQGAGYKKLIDLAIANYQAILNKFVNERLAVMEDKIQCAMDEHKVQLESANAGERQKIEKGLNDLKAERDNLKKLREALSAQSRSATGTHVDSSSAWPHQGPRTILWSGTAIPSIGYSLFGKTCAKCGHQLDTIATWPLPGGEQTIKCPKCGNVERW